MAFSKARAASAVAAALGDDEREAAASAAYEAVSAADDSEYLADAGAVSDHRKAHFIIRGEFMPDFPLP